MRPAAKPVVSRETIADLIVHCTERGDGDVCGLRLATCLDEVVRLSPGASPHNSDIRSHIRYSMAIGRHSPSR